MIYRHARPLQQVRNHTSSPWFESIRDELLKAEKKISSTWSKTKLTLSRDLYRQEKHRVLRPVHTALCQFCAEIIALSTSSNKLHQIVHALLNNSHLHFF